MAPGQARDLQSRVDELVWYHTIDVAPGVATKGWFDLRHAVDLIPFPDVRGKRCLDIGTWDGFYAFELERRGAAEVVAIDLDDLAGLDYPPEVRAIPTFERSATWVSRTPGFELAHELLGSSVSWEPLNVYDLDPARVGKFDVVVCGSLLVHLRDPVRALDAIRSVTAGQFVSIDFLHTPLELLARRRPLFELRGVGSDFQWWLASDAGLRRLLEVGGFTIEAASKRFLLRHGSTYTATMPRSTRSTARQLVNWALTGDRMHSGHLHRAYRARPRF
jgi:tRNA (mo5U34)-methyltransferase